MSDLSITGLGKHYELGGEQLTILDALDLSVAAGESVAIMGPSGSGKSTLLNILGTLETPSSGDVRIGGDDPFALGAEALARFRNEQIGFVFQEHHLLPQCSVLENVAVPALAFGGRDPVPRARQLLERVGLGARLSHRPGELSGGERQRVAIARALLNEPKLVLADEPTGNLDRATAESVADLLVELPKSDNVCLVVVTHSPALAARFGQALELRDGKLVPLTAESLRGPA